ncbi:MAG: Uncharacterized protein G01um101472_583 [Parcubacteria group bacterium Gr01-1014_72]|nr:MAG: Uncharacterized protein G01um101472_583 [Parcubacteria group bacterium Gr01-1014_72]
MKNRRKLIFITLATLLLLATSGALYYFLALRPAVPANEDTGTKTGSPIFPSTGGARATTTRGTTGDGAGVRERASGHIFEVPFGKGGSRRLSNKTIPRVYEAYFAGKSRDSVILRYLRADGETIETFVGKIKPSASAQNEGEVVGSFLPRNISDLDVSPSGTALFYLLPQEGGGSSGVTALPDGTRRTEVWTSPLRELLPSYVSDEQIALASKAANGADGILYLLNSKTALSTILLGPLPGLTALVSPNRAWIIYAVAEGGFLTTAVRDVKKGRDDTLSVRTLPEKCVWSRRDGEIAFCAVPSFFTGGTYPDDWYQGVVSFEDELWKIDAESGRAQRLAGISDEAGVLLDAVRLSLSPDESHLLFINKRDGTLWAYRVAN